MNNRLLEYDCLYYRVRNEKLTYQELSNIIEDMIPYCFRPLNETEILNINLINTRDQNFTFEELRFNNITTQELLLWSAPIDLVEQYQYYLNEINSSHSLLSNEIFYNCTKPRFGLQCEYSFEFSEYMSIDQIVEIEFSRKLSYYESSDLLIKLPCYIHIQCDRGDGSNLCLDWREICDGRIDCLNDGLDEKFCFDMEINECNENEYRCHNGLCIPEEFWEDGINEADCLDRSDELADISYTKYCFQDPKFRCEEHSCRSNWHEFTCGDGECVQKFDKCHNGRHLLLTQSMIIQGNLSDKCWIMMICLTKLVNEINGILCQILLNNNNSIFEYLKTCDTIFQFPVIPVHLGHIRFLYEKPYLKFNNQNFFLFPDYICYDIKLCDYILPTFFYKNLTCIHRHELEIEINISGHPWIDIILELNSYFSSCLIIYLSNENKLIYENSSIIYSCQNSSKLISKYRIMDENKDCFMNDDENNNSLSCLLNDKYRIQCPNQTLCLSSLHKLNDCPEYENQYNNKIPFQIFCDGFQEYFFEDINGQQYTDESECNYWPCNNIYSRCDGYWLCSNGEDEDNCNDENICPLGTHPCISPMNYSITCLSSKRVGDNINDCLGASDELYFCRQLYPLKKDYERFRCLNSDLCLSALDLCNNIQSCPLGDDENFCQNYRFICQNNSINNQNLIENILCQLSEYKKSRIIYFSIQSSIIYPQELIISQTTTSQTKNQDYYPIKTIKSRMSQSSWECNRGLPIHIQLNNNLYKSGCMCPPSYYGDLCQYQNERISLTLGLIRANKQDIYTIIIMLIDDNDKSQTIDSYDQFDSISSHSCGIKFNRYILYSTRPKNISKNYFLRIDVYEKRTMSYRGSWHLSIPFLFLPVNRLVTRLIIPSILSSCSLICNNGGQCLKYINKEKYFCRCLSGWSGITCDIPINYCQNCSLDSICIGSINNRSICICPLTKFGPRCLLSSSCRINTCENNGQCIPADLSLPGNDYICICSNQFYGSKCQYIKSNLDVYLENFDSIPSYLTAFFLTVSDESEPKSTIILQKLTLFQRIVTFHISIPYHIVIIQSNRRFYLAVVQQTTPKIDLSTTINPNRECLSIEYIFNSTLMKLPRFQRIKFYHLPCQNNFNLICFLDENYLCLCTNDHHANCMLFDYNKNLECSSKSYCENQGQCLQDHPTCPSTIICVCHECFFGNQCQFYAKGFGLTLDEILGYEIKHNVLLSQQTFAVKLSAIITMIMFIIGIINGICSIITFNNKISQEVGCGMYLLASSITSFIIIILFTLKFWFLLLSSIDFFAQRFILYLNCMLIEPLLKILLYIDNWLNGCIAIERAFAVYKGIYFNKIQSKYIAKWIILLLIIFNIILLIPQLSKLYLFDDQNEKRTWCVILYSSRIYIYNSFLIFFHLLIPFFINFFSAIFIIIETTRQRIITNTEYLYIKQFKNKLKQHKHLLISPIILIILSLPRLIISFTLDCKKSSKHFWLYLIGYFISFMPSVFIFVIFVLPSIVFKKAFKQAILRGQRRLSLLKIKFYLNKRL